MTAVKPSHVIAKGCDLVLGIEDSLDQVIATSPSSKFEDDFADSRCASGVVARLRAGASRAALETTARRKAGRKTWR